MGSFIRFGYQFFIEVESLGAEKNGGREGV
jgi:hypothetical protein